MHDTWYVVADGARAEVLRPTRDRFETVFRVEGQHPRTSELVSDGPGRVIGAGEGGHRHSLEPSTDPHAHLKALFARDLAARLEQGLHQRACDALVLVAEPRSLGALRAALGPRARRAVTREVPKDLTPLGAKDLQDALQSIAARAAP